MSYVIKVRGRTSGNKCRGSGSGIYYYANPVGLWAGGCFTIIYTANPEILKYSMGMGIVEIFSVVITGPKKNLRPSHDR